MKSIDLITREFRNDHAPEGTIATPSQLVKGLRTRFEAGDGYRLLRFFGELSKNPVYRLLAAVGLAFALMWIVSGCQFPRSVR